LAKDRNNNEYYALKILKKAEIIRLKQVDHVISENTILSNINHPFIVHRFCFLINGKPRSIWTDFAKIQDIYTLFWNISQEVNYSLTWEVWEDWNLHMLR